MWMHLPFNDSYSRFKVPDPSAPGCHAAQSHRLEGLYVYDTSYNFSILPWSPTWRDTDLNARTTYQCDLPTSMPAAPTAALQNPYDHFAVIRWDAPVDNGATVTEYVYQICKTDDVSGGSCSDQDAPVRYM